MRKITEVYLGKKKLGNSLGYNTPITMNKINQTMS